MAEDCKFEDLIREMHGDVKVLVNEFKKMNGEMLDSRAAIEGHKKESIPYRRKIDMLWAGVHFSKWVVMLIFGGGLIFNLLELWMKNHK